jgi:hypothetical protein
MLMYNYTDATAASQALIAAHRSRLCCRWCGVASGNS